MKTSALVALAALLVAAPARATLVTFNVLGTATVERDDLGLMGGAATVPFSLTATYGDVGVIVPHVAHIDVGIGSTTVQWRSLFDLDLFAGRVILRDRPTDEFSLSHGFEPANFPHVIAGPVAGYRARSLEDEPGLFGAAFELTDSTGNSLSNMDQPQLIGPTWDGGFAIYQLEIREPRGGGGNFGRLYVDVELDLGSVTSFVVPEPSVTVLLAAGAVAALRARRHRAG